MGLGDVEGRGARLRLVQWGGGGVVAEQPRGAVGGQGVLELAHEEGDVVTLLAQLFLLRRACHVGVVVNSHHLVYYSLRHSCTHNVHNLQDG